MAVVRNEDIATLQKVSDLLKRNSDSYNKEERFLIDEYDNIISKFENTKKKLSDKSNQYNKDHKDYHRITVNMYACRKSGNIERAKYWEEELAKLKKGE